jgi:hypothetical protein
VTRASDECKGWLFRTAKGWKAFRAGQATDEPSRCLVHDPPASQGPGIKAPMGCHTFRGLNDKSARPSLGRSRLRAVQEQASCCAKH